ncbi:vacuolar protein sorting-associated protein 35 [Cokeromyces recurvatus]|uniref:vacuolar protein sorting-associated protein 35 n=1 Tax=Cokeromyces recurvatus TaxID=90255 RepID=UPI00221E67C3|nr:vacuolar protein sorting-associated protein 35 [Cokeromyces recurvatus]KAI7903647.1 vacuolar protein sorting-associated protein 35 [Cokeromyces recurvatus]
MNDVESQCLKVALSKDKNRLMDGIKHCSSMLAELRTSSLSPKNYHELYITVFDAMCYLTSYLLEAHRSGQYHLGDLYEIVQYASNIIPRLYLMITVGSIYLSLEDSPPISEVLNDMIEMVKGVQHPIRGLFLRHYLGGMTRDFLSKKSEQLDVVVPFILTNFAEMNKLWVRLQYLGHTRDRSKHEMERKEIGTLVGTNLVRLSQLDGLNSTIYQRDILPEILSQVVYCHDAMTQEYLMEVIVQIFPDEFHLHTLKPFLATTAQLRPEVKIKDIIMNLLGRLTSFAKNEEKLQADNELFILFWNEIMDLIKKRQEFSIQDITSLLLSLANFSVLTYPTRLDYLDQIFLFTKDFISNWHTTKQSESNMLQLLLLPTKTWDILMFITTLKHYQPLLALQSYGTRRTVTLTILDSVLGKVACIDEPEQVYQILQICHVLVSNDNKNTSSDFVTQQLLQPYYTHEDNRNEQGWIARLIHLFYSKDEDVQFLLLSAARQQLEKGNESIIKTTFPSLIISGLKLAKRYYNKKPRFLKCPEKEEKSNDKVINTNNTNQFEDDDNHKLQQEKDNKTISSSNPNTLFEEWSTKMTTLFHFIHQTIMTYYQQCFSTESQSVQFLLMTGQSAHYCGLQEIANNFYLDALSVYEEGVSHSRTQFDTIVYSIGTFLSSRCDATLSAKVTLFSTKLLKKPDQSRALYLCSHLWEDTHSHLVECLQKSLNIANSCMDTITNVMLLIELLNQYLYYFGKEHSLALNELIDLTLSRMKHLQPQEYPIITSNSSSLLDLTKEDEASIIEYVTRQFNQTLNHLRFCQQASKQ